MVQVYLKVHGVLPGRVSSALIVTDSFGRSLYLAVRIGCEGVAWIQLAQDRDKWHTC